MSDTPSHSIEAEEHVLGAILLAQKIPNDVMEKLDSQCFFRESHGTIWTAAMSLHLQGKPTDAVSMQNQLEKTGQLNKAGGMSRLQELAALTPAVGNAGHHAQIVKEHRTRRRLHQHGLEVIDAAKTGNIDSLLQLAENSLHNISNGSTTRSALPITEGLDSLVEGIREAYVSGIAKTGIPTGFDSLDEIIHGLWPSQLVLLAARTGVGKTTLAQNIAENISDEGYPVFMASLEMSRYELQLRSLARAGRIDGDRLQTGQVTREEAERLNGAIQIVKERNNLLIHDDGIATPATLAALARRHHDQEELGLIVVDYIGLMKGEGNNKYEQVSDVSRNLKMLAQTLKVPVLALAQMNRKQDGRTEKAPMLSDLRDSGSLEQDADVVIFLHRESDHDPSVEDTGDINVIVEKNRKGKRGTAKMLFTQRFSRFLDPKRGSA